MSPTARPKYFWCVLALARIASGALTTAFLVGHQKANLGLTKIELGDGGEETKKKLPSPPPTRCSFRSVWAKQNLRLPIQVLRSPLVTITPAAGPVVFVSLVGFAVVGLIVPTVPFVARNGCWDGGKQSRFFGPDI